MSYPRNIKLPKLNALNMVIFCLYIRYLCTKCILRISLSQTLFKMISRCSCAYGRISSISFLNSTLLSFSGKSCMICGVLKEDILGLQICIGCIFRLSGVRGHIFSCPSLLLSILHPVIGEPTDSSTHRYTGIGGNEDSGAAHSSQESECEPVICSICLGVLQFTYFDDKKMLVKKDSADELAVSIANLVKKEGHEFDNFSLEVSIPPVIAENEHVVL